MNEPSGNPPSQPQGETNFIALSSHLMTLIDEILSQDSEMYEVAAIAAHFSKKDVANKVFNRLNLAKIICDSNLATLCNRLQSYPGNAPTIKGVPANPDFNDYHESIRKRLLAMRSEAKGIWRSSPNPWAEKARWDRDHYQRNRKSDEHESDTEITNGFGDSAANYAIRSAAQFVPLVDRMRVAKEHLTEVRKQSGKKSDDPSSGKSLIKIAFENLVLVSDELLEQAHRLLLNGFQIYGAAIQEWIRRTTTAEGRRYNADEPLLLVAMQEEARNIERLARVDCQANGYVIEVDQPDIELNDIHYSILDVLKGRKLAIPTRAIAEATVPSRSPNTIAPAAEELEKLGMIERKMNGGKVLGWKLLSSGEAELNSLSEKDRSRINRPKKG